MIRFIRLEWQDENYMSQDLNDKMEQDEHVISMSATVDEVIVLVGNEDDD